MKKGHLFIMAALFLFAGISIVIARAPSANLEDVVNGAIHTSGVQSDGSIMLGGDFTDGYILRVGDENVVDDSFGSSNTSGLFNGPVNKLAVLGDDSMVVAGDFSVYDQQIVGYIVKIGANGEVDQSFIRNMGTGFDGPVKSFDLMENGQIVVAGDFQKYDGYSSPGLIRLNGDGSIDKSLNVGSGFNHTVNTVKVLQSGEIMVGGSFTEFNGEPALYVARVK